MIGTASHLNELELAKEIGSFWNDPLGYVLFNFPWGEPGTPLERETGPDQWQREVLIAWGKQITERNFDGFTPVLPIEISVTSGHGIGKSALAAWCIKFIFDTRPNSRGTVTANTMPQLYTKTWAELGKWHNMSLTRHWARYHRAKTNMALISSDPLREDTWYVTGQTCKEENSESFAGQHAADSTSWYLFDEASAVPDKIWEVSDGGLTDGEPMRISFGNPTKNTGRFISLHKTRRSKRDAITFQIDSRKVKRTNKALIEQWIEDWGENSDFVRVRVRGLPPSQASLQFISTFKIEAAAAREAVSDLDDPLIMGVDIARFGDDKSVIRWRRGRDAKSIPPIRFEKLDTMSMASQIVMHAAGSEHTKHQVADAVIIDETGVGGGVVDRVRQLNCDCIGVNFADNPIGVLGLGNAKGEKYANRRAEMYGGLREWLSGPAAIDDDEGLMDELEGIEYGYNASNEIQLERKELIKKRLGFSPDDGDALALTFAEVVLPKKVMEQRFAQAEEDYHPMQDM